MNQENEKSATTTGTPASTDASTADIVAPATTPVATNNQSSPEANTAEDLSAATSEPVSEATVSSEINCDAPIAASDEPTSPTPAKVTVNAREGYRFVDQLRVHDENAKIYGDKENIDDLLKSIKAYGILDPLLITKDGRVISGHRRLSAAQKLGIQDVPVRVFESEDEIDILAALLEHNRQRVKSKAQIAAEASLQMRIKKEVDARRKAVSAATAVVETLPPGSAGKSRDVVGKILGLSGRTTEKAAATSDAISSLRKQGKTVAADKVESALNKGYDTGFKAAVNVGAIEKSKTKRQPKNGKSGAIPTPAPAPNPEASEKKPSETSELSSARATPSGTVDSYIAVEFGDKIVTFLRSKAATTMTTQQKRDLGRVLDDINTNRKNLGF